MNEYRISDFKKVKSNNLPIDKFLLKIQNYYSNPATKYSFYDLTKLFKNNNFSDSISNLIEDYIDNFQDEKIFNEYIISDYKKTPKTVGIIEV